MASNWHEDQTHTQPPSAPPPYNPSFPPLLHQTSLPVESVSKPQQSNPPMLQPAVQPCQSPPSYYDTMRPNPHPGASNQGHQMRYSLPVGEEQRYGHHPNVPRPTSVQPAHCGGMVPAGHRNIPSHYQPISAFRQQSYGDHPTQSQFVSPAVPTGYNIMDLFVSGNVLCIIPESISSRLPLKTDWGSVACGGAYTQNDCMFEVVVPRQDPVDWVIMLRNYQNKDRYISINHKGVIKAHKGVNENCEFHIRPVGSLETSTVSFESAVHPGFYLGMTSSGSTANASKITATSKQAQFTIRAHLILNHTNTNLKVFGRISILNQMKDRCVIQLRSKSSLKFLEINVKGKVTENHNNLDPLAWFIVYDHGIGVVSLRSYQHAGYWLRVVCGVLQGKGISDLAADFRFKENYDGTVCLESVYCPGVFVVPPTPVKHKNSQPTPSPSTDFTLSYLNIA